MAIYHLSHGMVSRSTGRSSVQSAAYITGEKLHESRRDLNVNYQNRHSDIAFTTTLAPEYAPELFHSVKVWDHFENFEDEYGFKRYKTDQTRETYLNSAQTAQTIVVALPRELSVDVCKELLTQFAKERFVSRGLVVTLAMHDDEGNPHAHLQISRRAVNENSELSWAKDRAICSRLEVHATRNLWANLTNQYLEREGFETRITEKSFADLGIQLHPTQHRGWIADKLGEMGISSRIVEENTQAFENNREILIDIPGTILPELTQNNATFTQLQLLKTVQKRVGDDAPLVAQVFERALQESIVVGEGIDGQIRYTSPSYKAMEEQAIGLVTELASATFAQPQLTKTGAAHVDHANHANHSIESHLSKQFPSLSPEQKQAVLGLTQEHRFSVLVGRAGAGKTTTLRAVSELYKNAGHKVLGTSLAAMAADNLGKEAGIPAATIHSLIYQWERYQTAQDKFLSFNSIIDEGILKQLDWYQDLKRFEGSALTNNTVLIVDEAGMVGTRLWNELLVSVNQSGAKLIAVGDDHQFKAIEAGDFFREMKTQAEKQNQAKTQTQNQDQDQDQDQKQDQKQIQQESQEQANNQTTEAGTLLFELGTIYRQKEPWMKDASVNLANLEINQALSTYEQRGHVHQTSRAMLAEEIATAYTDSYLKTLSRQGTEQQPSDDPIKCSQAPSISSTQTTPPTCLVLAFTNAQTSEINQAIREQLKQKGLLDREDKILINNKPFAIGDRIVFLENDKTRLTITDSDGVIKEGITIKNGTQGKITGINQQGDIQVALTNSGSGADNLMTSIKCISSTTPKVAIGQPEPEPTRTYNYTNIAHGYAVTTHKAQGQTVDQVFVAASKNMDAKGLYVAMTRHRDDVQLFYAKEDFSTFKALSSHMSRFEHKDLVKDYTIRPEHEDAWQRVQEYRLSVLDAAAARKQASKTRDSSVWGDYHQIKQDQINLGKEILGDFDKHKLYVNQAGLTQEMLQITTGQKARALSNAEEKAKLTVELYGETAQVARYLWRDIRKTHPGNQCYQHLQYKQFIEMRSERNSLAHTIHENFGLHREFLNEFSRLYGINKRTVEAQSKQFIAQQHEKNQHQSLVTTPLNTPLNTIQKPLENRDKIDYDKELYNTNYGKYESNIYNYTQQYSGSQDQQGKSDQPNYTNHINQQYQTKSIDPALIKQELNSRIKDLAYQFLGKPQSQKATEWRYGNKRSISIHVAGTKQGLYSNFETGESGNALKFIQDQLECDHKQAFKWGAQWLGEGITRSSLQAKPVTVAQPLPQQKQEWTPIFPAPTPSSIPVDLKSQPQMAYMLKGRQEIARYAYTDAEKNILGFVVRLEDKNGHKITPTFTFCQNDKGEKQWRWKGFGNARPLYGLDQLKEKSNAPVLVVEGEKTCETARTLFPDHAVVTWSGGAGAVQKSDWSVLKDRSVIIWPDNDKAGTNAAQKISSILEDQGNEKVSIVDLPSTLPHKWDLADKVPDGLDVVEISKNCRQQKEKEPSQEASLASPVLAHHDLSEQEQRHLSIANYLNAQLKSQDWVNAEITTYVKEQLGKDPLQALVFWRSVNNDLSFMPMNFAEMQQKAAQANSMLEQSKLHIPENNYYKLVEEMQTNPQAVINIFNKIIDKQRNTDIVKYADLSKECSIMHNTGNQEKKINEITTQLKELSKTYATDEKFQQAIARNDLTRNVQQFLDGHKLEKQRDFER